MARRRKYTRRRYNKGRPKTRTRTVYKTRYRSRPVYRRAVSRARSFGGGHKQVIDGVLAGAAGSFLNGKIPYASPLANIGIGYFRNNSTLKTLGAMQLGAALIGGFGFGSGKAGGGYL